MELQHVHNVFHISQLRKYLLDPDHILVTKPIEVTKDLTYEQRPIKILDHRIKQLRNKRIPLVKVPWANHMSSEATWEKEEEMRAKDPHLFEAILLLTRLISIKDETFNEGRL